MIMRKTFYVIGGLLATVAIAGAAGFWFGLPIIGGPSYCGSTVNAVCVSTIPAGPAKSGLELVPSDTFAPNGQNPQTAYLSMADLNALPGLVAVPLTGGSIVPGPTVGRLIVNPAGTISLLSISLATLSASVVDGQTFYLDCTQTVTTMTVTDTVSGHTINGAPTSCSSTTFKGWYWNAAAATWFEIQ